MKLATAFPTSKWQEFPPPLIPQSKVDQLSLVTPDLMASRQMPAPAWDIDHWLQCLGSPEFDDIFVYGLDGYGINSRALHYYWLQPDLAIFIQQPWGNLYQESASSGEISSAIHKACALDCILAENKSSLLESGEKLVVVDSSRLGQLAGIFQTASRRVQWLSVSGSVFDFIDKWFRGEG